ncbi:MAG: hypothetical protein J6T10_26590 [Methanobrevibacter sp.]|nr:hypothetical protein [Methanobrevibacter sp.]
MEDRFKFRVFLKYNQIMYDIDSYCFLQGLNKCVFHFTNGGQKTLKNDDFILMQCTRRKDKNGKLIYEEDIVRLKAKNGMTFDYAVKFKNYCFILEYINGKLKGTKARDFAKQYAQPQKMYEHGYMVIGNIYENPELLED